MAEAIAALVVRILADTSEMVGGVKKASTELDGFENQVVDVDKALASIKGSGGRANESVSTLSATYKQFDGVLQSVGISIGPQVKGLEDIVNAAGKTAAGIGAVSTAGLALGAGYAGWQLGRMIADFTGADKAVQGFWESFLGGYNLAEETVGAKQDVINRALALGATEGLSYAQSLEFIETQMRKNADASIDWSTKMAAAQKEIRGVSDATAIEIEIARTAGATTEQLTNKYDLSALALQLLAERHRDVAVATAEHAKAMKKAQADAEAYDVEIAKQIVLFDNLDKAAKKATDKKSKEDAAQGWWNDMSRSVQASNWERNYLAEQTRLGAVPPSGGVVVNPTGGGGSTNITINAPVSPWDQPDAMNRFVRTFQDEIAQRSGLSNTYTRR